MTDVVGDDLVDGGPGFDSVQDWSSTTTDPAFAVSVTVDGVANDGRPSGERDNVIGVERFDAIAPGLYGLGDLNDSIDLPNYGASVVQGRGGDDRLTGGNDVETIDGGAGDDRLEGGYNNDTITGGAGRDAIFGDATGSQCGTCIVHGPVRQRHDQRPRRRGRHDRLRRRRGQRGRRLDRHRRA